MGDRLQISFSVVQPNFFSFLVFFSFNCPILFLNTFGKAYLAVLFHLPEGIHRGQLIKSGEVGGGWRLGVQRSLW